MATEVLSDTGFEAEVKKLVDKQLRTYENDHDRIISDFHAEKEITNSYNGRQLLELLQNADDAGTEEVLIHFDRKAQILRISNNGAPFNINGVKSLMLAYNSSKNKRKFIGNKGLGFRSVLNWVNKVRIKTKPCILEFSPEQARTNFEELISDESERRKLIEREEELKEGEVPFGILSLPNYNPNEGQQEWETIIELSYKDDFEEAIEDQIRDIQPEILLFLNNTRKIYIKGFEESDQVLQRTDLSPSEKGLKRIAINGVEYNIYNSPEKPLPDNKKKFYSYKIAWQDDLRDQYSTFYTYFPTQVNTHLPFLIHGTFDLDPTRNHFNKSEDNDFILNEIAEAIGDIAVQYLKTENESDWRAYQFLSVTGRSENRHLTSFFEKIEKLRSTLDIYPCVDSKYVAKDKAMYHGNPFSGWITKNNLGLSFPGLVNSIPEEIYLDVSYKNKYSIEELIGIFESVSCEISSIEERAELIKVLVEGDFGYIESSESYLPLLLNSKNQPVLNQEKVFLEEDKDYKIPQDLIPISFLSRDLYQALLSVLEEEITERRMKDENLSRPLKRCIGDIVNVGARDINEVIRFIVSEVNHRIDVEKDYSRKIQKVLELNKLLFSIFKTNKERKGTLNLNIPILNRVGKIIFADKLFLGKNFPSGVVMEKIFENIYDDKDYVCSASELGFQSDYYDLFEDYLLWIGVVKYTRLEKYEETLWKSKDGYTDFVFSYVQKPQDLTTIKYSVLRVKNFKTILTSPHFSIEKLIAWIQLDPILQNALEFNNDRDSFKHSYSNSEKPIHWKPSYIFYQFQKYIESTQPFYLTDLVFSKELGYESLELEHDLFLELGKKKEDVHSILNKLKIKSRFSDLSIEEAYEVLSILPIKDEDEKYGRRLYQYFYKIFRNHIPKSLDEINLPNELLATKEGHKRYVNREEVFYTDNATLPEIITDKIWMFDYPKRTGEQKVSKLFGVQTLKDINVIVDSRSIYIHPLDSEFQKWYGSIKPYLLTYRLLTLSGQELKNEAVKLLKETSIQIVSDLRYKFLDEEWHILRHGEFMVDEQNNYFICSKKSYSLSSAKEDPGFVEAFAEVLTTIFTVNDHKDDYRLIFQDKSSLNQTKFLIKRNELEDNLEEAQNYLGLSSSEMTLWNKVFEERKLRFPEDVVTQEDLSAVLLNKFKYQLPSYYPKIDLLEGYNQETYDFLKDLSGFFELDLKDILPKNSSGLYPYYRRKLENVVKDYKGDFNHAIYHWLNSEKKEQKNLIKYQTDFDNLPFDAEIEQSLEQYKYNLTLDLAIFLKEWLEKKFKIALSGDRIDCISIHKPYNKLLDEYSGSLDMVEEEEVRSLFYFSGNEDEIKSHLKKITIEEKGEEDKISEENKVTGRIVLGKAKKKSFKTGKSKRNNHVHSNARSKRKQLIGKRSEELVFDTLKAAEDVEKVQWVSGSSKTASDKSDAKHYDIEYKLKGSDNWKLLEVKTYNGSYFHLTRAEKDTALKYKKDYEIALVDGTDIYMLKDLFEEDFEDNDLFEAVPSEYIISLKIIADVKE